MDIKNLFLGLNGCEDEIQKIHNTRFVQEDLSDYDKGKLQVYRERKAEIIKTLEGMGFTMHWLVEENRWAIYLNQKVGKFDALHR